MTLPDPAPTVLVSVGTDFHPFDRLVTWVDGWLAARSGREVTCLVQYGASRPPQRATGVAFLGHGELHELMAHAHAVVTHGGPSTIAEARRHGHRPIVVARAPELGEHVDDHQQRFARRLEAQGLVRLAPSAESLGRALEEALTAGRGIPASAVGQPAAPPAAMLFGRLVEELFTTRGR
jgi:UDP-N-acetylglucosamine transferase subunit ALG13